MEKESIGSRSDGINNLSFGWINNASCSQTKKSQVHWFKSSVKYPLVKLMVVLEPGLSCSKLKQRVQISDPLLAKKNCDAFSFFGTSKNEKEILFLS
jgi:hypothetical protein